MCGGGCCNPLGACMGEMAYTMERLAACLAALGIVSCLMLTVVVMLGSGIGLGYNYCFVETKLNATLRAAKAQKSARNVPTPPRTTTDGPTLPPRRRRSKDLITTLPERPRSDQMINVVTQSNETGKILKDDGRKQMSYDVEPEVEIRPTMVIPLKHSGLKSLIDKLQKRNRNFRIELLADRLIQE